MPLPIMEKYVPEIAKLTLASGGSIFIGELFGLIGVKVTKTTMWNATLVKIAIKAVWSGILWAVGAKVNDPQWSKGALIMGYSSMGTVVIDLFNMLYPGGIGGIISAAMRAKSYPPQAGGRGAQLLFPMRGNGLNFRANTGI